MPYVFKSIQSPVGLLKLVASERGLAGILWENDNELRTPHLMSAYEDPEHPVLLETHRQLEEYFSGIRTCFDITLDFTGNDFQKRVWAALLTIPYGETRTYGQLAAQLSNSGAARAVGAANGKNPISIIAPCHRVIGANGKLTGFAGGIDKKACLLELESRVSRAAVENSSMLHDAVTNGQ